MSRYRTHVPCSERQIPNPWATREVSVTKICSEGGRGSDRQGGKQAGDRRENSRWYPTFWRKKPGTSDATPEAERDPERDSSPPSPADPSIAAPRDLFQTSRTQKRETVPVSYVGIIGSSRPPALTDPAPCPSLPSMEKQSSVSPDAGHFLRLLGCLLSFREARR